METSLDSPANSSMKLDLSGASPSLFRGEEAKRNQINNSGKANSSKTKYTKLRSSVTPLQKKAKARKKVEDGSESESPSEVEDDQPSGKCQYVGDTSNMSSTTINNTSMASTASVRRKGNSSVRQLSQSVTSPATTSTAPLSPPPVSKTSSVFSCLAWVVVAGVAIMVYAVMLEGQGNNNLSNSSQDTREHWLGARNMFRSGLKSLVTQFPNQSITTWKMISATLKSPMASSPEYPGVLLLLSTPSSQDTAACLASRLAQLASKAFSQPGLQHLPANQQQHLVISSLSLPTVDPHQTKEDLTTLLHSSLSTWGVSAITSLHHLHPVPALTLHAFADNSNAPYKQAAIILTLSDSDDEEVATSLEKRAEIVLARLWSKELGEDKVYALISRLVVSVADVQRENEELLATC